MEIYKLLWYNSLVTIRKHGSVGGICKCYSDEKSMPTYETLKGNIMEKLAGKAAVELRFGGIDMGAESDLDDANYLIRDAVETLCVEGFDYGYDIAKYSDKQAVQRVDRITEKVYDLIREYYEACTEILKANRLLLDEIATELLEKRTLLYEDLEGYSIVG